MKDKSTNNKTTHSIKSFLQNLARRLPKLDPLPKGLPIETNIRLLALQTRLLIETLSQTENKNRAAEAAFQILENYDRAAFLNKPLDSIECRKGCSYCCHGFVSATAPEIFYLAGFIQEKSPENVSRLSEQSKLTKEKNADIPPFERYRYKIPCTILDNNFCMAYKARPLACRAIASLSLAECEQTWRNEKETIPIPIAFINLRRQYESALRAALKHLDMDWKSYELTSALHAVLTTENAQERWLNGEDIFAEAEIDPVTKEENAKPIIIELDFILNEIKRHTAKT